MKIYTEPRWSGPDAGEGGVRQVMEHVAPYLEALGVEWVDAPDKADLVHYHMSPYANTRRWLESHPETPVVSSCHGLYWSEYDWDRGSLAANADVAEGLRLADVVTAPSEWVARALRRGMLLDVRVVPHGVDLDEFTVAAKPGTYALYDKTRVDPVCDPSPVIALAQRMPDQRFVMTGDPPVDLPNVMKLGRIPYADARELTRGAGVYLAVTRETFGLATLQAMACGVPVVGYAFGGQAEIVGEGGILVAPGDIDGLVSAMKELAVKRDELAGRARLVAGMYTWQAAAEGYMAAYRDALAAHASPVRVTVITTAYNAEATIQRTIISALTAMNDDDEMIIVDDASTDNTGIEIMQALRAVPADRVRHLTRAENGYLAQARNDALAVARGRYVTCLDADDELMPGALDTLAGALDADRSTQIAYGKLRFVRGEDGEPEDYGHGPGESPWPPDFDLAAQMAATNFSPVPYSAMVRTPWLKRAGGWRTRCRTAEDLDLWMRLVSGGARPRRVTEAQVLTYYTSDKSMSATEPLPDWGQWYPWTGAAGQRCSPPWGIAFGPPAHMKELWWPVSHHAEPRVAVVIPVGPGHERYVLDAVDSVQAQTLRQWECIVVNDTDHGDGYSVDWMQSLPAWARVFYNHDQGVAAARNYGLSKVTAPLVVFLDADDYLDADALEHLVATIDRNPGLAVVYPDYWERDPVPDATRRGRVAYQYTPHELPDWTCDWVDRPGAIHGITAVYRTAAVRDVGGFDVLAAGWEDGDLQMALAYAGHCSARLARRAYVYCRDRGTVGTWHYADSEERATKIGAWLKAKYEGRTNMSCGGCAGQQGRAASPVVSAFGGDGGGAAVVLSGDMVEVVYVGGREGDFTLRGRSSGAQYRFGKGRHARKAVLREDLEFFGGNQDYRVEAEGMAQPDGPPRLAADGPPHGHRASVA